MTERLRVLHVIETGGPGGAEAIFADLVTNLDPDQIESTVALMRGGGWLEERLARAGISPVRLKSGGRFDVTLIRSLARLAREKRVHVIHSHLMDMNFYASIAGVVARVPVVATEHGDVHHPGKEGRIHRAKPKTIARLSSSWVAVSEFTRRKLMEGFEIPGGRIRVIYNGIRFPEPSTARTAEEIRADIGVPRDAFLIGAVGSLYPVKGHASLIEALKQVLEMLPSAHVAIAGRGDEEFRLRNRSEELGVADRVHLLGLRDDVSDLLRAFDLFVMPSLSEGLPLSLLEAMAAGRVVLASRVGGVPEVIEDGVNGMLVNPEDVTGLAGRIVEAAGMGEKREEMEAAARRTIEERFAIRSMVEAYQDVYLSVARKR